MKNACLKLKPDYLLIFTLVFLSGILAGLVFLRPLFQDEGVFLTIAKGISNGSLPYQNFFDHKPPGIYFTLAPIAHIANIYGAKTFLILCLCLLGFLTFRLSEKIKPRSGVCALVFLLFALIFFEGYLIVAETFLAIAIAFSCLLCQERRDPAALLAAGILGGIALIFKQTAVISVAAIMVGLIISRQKLVWIFFAGLVMPLLGVTFYLASNNLLQEGLHQIIFVNLFFYPKEPLQKVMAYLMPIFIVTLPFWYLAGKSFFQKASLPLILLVLLPLPLLFYRHYPHYFIQIIPFAAIAAGLCWPENYLFKKILPLFLITISSLFFIRFLSVNLPKFADEKRVTSDFHDEAMTILAENQYTGFYFSLETRPLNRYLYITEINDKSEAAEYKTIADLKNNDDAIIFWPSDPNFAYARKLQSYILNNYEPISRYGRIGLTVYKKKVILQ